LLKHEVLLSLCSLLDDPNPLTPVESDAAKLYMDDNDAYQAKVREYTAWHATGMIPHARELRKAIEV